MHDNNYLHVSFDRSEPGGIESCLELPPERSSFMEAGEMSREMYCFGALRVEVTTSPEEPGVISFRDHVSREHLFSLRCEAITRLEPERDPFEDTSPAERKWLEGKRKIYRETLEEIIRLYMGTWVMAESKGRELARAEIRGALGILPAPKTPREAGLI